jgi:hypothetical protein
MQITMGKHLVMAGDTYILPESGGLFASLGVLVFAVKMAGGALLLRGMGLPFLRKSRMALGCDAACLGKSPKACRQKNKNKDHAEK